MLLLVGIVVAVTLLVVFFDLAARRRPLRVFGSTAKQYELIVCPGSGRSLGGGGFGCGRQRVEYPSGVNCSDTVCSWRPAPRREECYSARSR